MKEWLYRMKVRALCLLPHRLAHSIIYKKLHGNRWNYHNPKTYDEKIHWHIVNTYNKNYSKYADKFAVREYVAKCGFSDLLVPLIKVYNSADEIKIEELPDKFFLITNHASGKAFYEICTDKKSIDIMYIKKKFNAALNTNFSMNLNCEYHYKNIPPKILCEELLEDKNNRRIDDYKIVCSKGKPVAILVCTERDQGRDYYSTNWEYLEYTKTEYRSKSKADRPECLEQMLDVAAKLSEPFPIARIDFYIVNSRLYFSEITLTPSSGYHYYLNDLGQEKLGVEIPPHTD